jgi:drug/metabolite transporter (DMT)-like permease
MKFDKKLIIGAGAIMLAALFWSLDGVFIRPKFYVLPAGLVVFLEHFLGFLLLVPFIFIDWKKIKKLRFKDWSAVVWVSVFGGLIGTLMITKAFFAAMGGQVTFATVVILQKLQPVFALILARIVLGEKLSKKFYLWAGLAIVAGYFLAFGKHGFNLSEINLFHSAAWFAFLAAFAFGSSTVFGKRIVNHLDYKSTAALRFGLTSILALIFILITGDIYQISSLTKLHWEFLLLIIFTSGAASMFLYYFGLKRITASVATICELFWPLSAVALDYFLNKNILNPAQIVASLVLLFAFYKVVSEGKNSEILFTAQVVDGAGRGARLGFPTINLNKIDIDIDYGVYLVQVKIDGKIYKALLHFGGKETFSEDTSSELFIKENILNINKKNVIIKIDKKIRDIIRFDKVEDLQEQVQRDMKLLD